VVGVIVICCRKLLRVPVRCSSAVTSIYGHSLWPTILGGSNTYPTSCVMQCGAVKCRHCVCSSTVTATFGCIQLFLASIYLCRYQLSLAIVLWHSLSVSAMQRNRGRLLRAAM
jgi:hypothetical protein